MGIGNIVSDIKGIIDTPGNVVANLFGDASKKYPNKIGNSLTASAVTNSRLIYNDSAWRKSLGFAFDVVRAKGTSFNRKDGFQEFRLQINPQELTQDEIFAIEVTPTLRGVVVEHQGVTLKDIVISGTTGISPGRKEGGALSRSGRALLARGHSGYEEFHELRSYFRMYVEAKRLDVRENGELRMIFKNFKDQEYLFVEPQKFTLKRSAQKPFMYDYTIALKAIGVADITPTGGSWLDTLDRIADIIDDVQAGLDNAVKTISAAIGIISRIERDIEDTILNPIRSVNDALISMQGGAVTLFSEFGIFRRGVENLVSEAERVRDNWNDFIGTSDVIFNEATGRTPTIVGDINRIPTFLEFQIGRALNRIISDLLTLLSRQDMFERDSFDTQSAVLEKTISNLESLAINLSADRSGSSAIQSTFTVTKPNSVRSIQVLGGDTLQVIAARELGDPDRYRELIILNSLRPPYISATGGPGVLKFGQKILLPQATPLAPTGALRGRNYPVSAGQSETEKNFGVDIRLTDGNDLAISNVNDFDLISGVENLSQAIALKIFYEKGSLQRHQGIGTGLVIGTKMTAQRVQDIRTDLIASLGADPRIESVPFVDVSVEGNTILLNMVVKPKDLAEPIPIALPIPNG